MSPKKVTENNRGRPRARETVCELPERRCGGPGSCLAQAPSDENAPSVPGTGGAGPRDRGRARQNEIKQRKTERRETKAISSVRTITELKSLPGRGDGNLLARVILEPTEQRKMCSGERSAPTRPGSGRDD